MKNGEPYPMTSELLALILVHLSCLLYKELNNFNMEFVGFFCIFFLFAVFFLGFFFFGGVGYFFGAVLIAGISGIFCCVYFICRFKFDNSEDCSRWYERLKRKCVTSQSCLKDMFAFAFYAWGMDNMETAQCDTVSLTCLSPRGK